MDEEECKKTAASFVRLIASLNAVRLMAFGVGAAGGIVEPLLQALAMRSNDRNGGRAKTWRALLHADLSA